MRKWIAVILLLAAAALAYWPLMTAQFTLWDDAPNVWQNSSIALGRGVSAAWTSTDDAIYMPVTRTAWAVLAAIASQPKDGMGSTLSPTPFHAANVVLHFASALLVHRLLRKLELSSWPALAGALLFALHPIQVEAVGWVSGLKDVLAGCLSLGAMNAYVDAAVNVDDTTRRRRHRLSTVLFVLAVLAKPTALVLPAMLLLIDFALLRRPWRQSLRNLAPLFAISVVTAILAAILQPALVTPPVAIPLRPLVAADALIFYLRQLVWPFAFCIDYGRTPAVVLARSPNWLPLVAVAGLVVAAVIGWKRGRRREVIGLALFLVAVLPVLGWKRFEFQYYSTVADHYVYLSMFGAALLVASMLERFSGRFVAAMVVGILSTLGVRTHRQSHRWHDTQSLADHALTINARSIAARMLLGGFEDLRAGSFANSKRADEAMAAWERAIEQYDRALAIDPRLIPALDAAATACWRLHDVSAPADALSYERRAMAYWMTLDDLVPTLPAPLQSNFAGLPARLGKIALDLGMNAEAARYYERAVADQPFDGNANAGLKMARDRMREAASRPAARNNRQ